MEIFSLHPDIVSAIDKDYSFYWKADYPFMELRAITYTWENGKFRSKFIHLFNLKTQLKDICLTQQELMSYGSVNSLSYYEILEEAYWKKFIPLHPRINNFLENSLVELGKP